MPESELQLQFGDDPDVIMLTYTVTTSSGGFDLASSASIRFVYPLFATYDVIIT